MLVVSSGHRHLESKTIKRRHLFGQPVSPPLYYSHHMATTASKENKAYERVKMVWLTLQSCYDLFIAVYDKGNYKAQIRRE